MSALIELFCPAKINLGLRVTGKREDGYHDLETIFQRITLFDRLRIEVTGGSGITLSCPGSELPADETNLVGRAACDFLEKASIHCGVKLTLHKKIPVSAGLGGGSSNAASTILGLNLLLGKPLNQKEMLTLGTKLGADVPFFVAGISAAFARGIGNKLTIISCPHMWFILVYPPIEVSTAWVYANLDLGLTRSDHPHIRRVSNQRSFKIEEVLDVLYNDLETVTIKLHPIIDTIRKHLVSLGAIGALMSGSGPTVFGLFPDRNNAEAALRKLTSVQGWNVSLACSF